MHASLRLPQVFLKNASEALDRLQRDGTCPKDASDCTEKEDHGTHCALACAEAKYRHLVAIYYPPDTGWVCREIVRLKSGELRILWKLSPTPPVLRTSTWGSVHLVPPAVQCYL